MGKRPTILPEGKDAERPEAKVARPTLEAGIVGADTPGPDQDTKTPENSKGDFDMGNILINLPKWILGTAFITFVAAMLISLAIGVPFTLWGHLNGWSWTKAEAPIISEPRTELEWRQRKFVADTLMSTDNDLQPFLDEIYRCFPDFRATNPKSSEGFITSSDADKIIDGAAGDYIFLYKSIIQELNRLEALSSAYQYGVADKKMFEDSYEELIKKWYARLHKFTLAAKAKCKCDWNPVDELAASWKVKLPDGDGSTLVCTKSPLPNKSSP